jgi:hypothetical protein
MITVGDIFRGRLVPKVKPFDGRLYAYVFNNYWGTNYKASQDGDMVFAFSLRLSAGALDPVAATRFGWESLSTMPDPRDAASRSLWAEPAQEATPVAADASSRSLLRLSYGPVLVGGLAWEEGGLIAHLYNPSSAPAPVTVSLPGLLIEEARRVDLAGSPQDAIPVTGAHDRVEVVVPARGLAAIRLLPRAPR